MDLLDLAVLHGLLNGLFRRTLRHAHGRAFVSLFRDDRGRADFDGRTVAQLEVAAGDRYDLAHCLVGTGDRRIDACDKGRLGGLLSQQLVEALLDGHRSWGGRVHCRPVAKDTGENDLLADLGVQVC